MASPIHDDSDAIDPAAARVAAKMRLMMLISGLTTFGAIVILTGVIAYKLMHMPEPGGAAPVAGQVAEETVALPAGAKVGSSVVADGRIVVTIEIGGATEIRTYDLLTLKPAGRLRFAPQP